MQRSLGAEVSQGMCSADGAQGLGRRPATMEYKSHGRPVMVADCTLHKPNVYRVVRAMGLTSAPDESHGAVHAVWLH